MLKLFLLLLSLILPSINGLTATSNIPGLSEMAAIGLKLLKKPFDYFCSNPETDQCVSETSIINSIREDMKENSTKIREYVHSTSAVGIVIKNSRSYPIHYHWLDDYNNGVYQGRISKYGTTATLSYIGHRFYFTKNQDDKYSDKIYQIKVDGNKNLFIVPPNKNDRSYVVDNHRYLKLVDEKLWRENYEKQTGYPWLSHYDITNGPRKPTELPMYSADYIGQKYKIKSNESYWICVPESLSATDISKCRTNKPITMDMTVESIHPPIFRIENTVSDIEADFIINISKPKLYRSTVGGSGIGMTSSVRTSFNGRLGKSEHPIVNTIYKRANDIFGFNENYDKFESLQVLHYSVGQEYTPHHDFGESNQISERVFTLLFYLNNQLNSNAGGETYFPKAMGKGIGLHPGKGNSVMFYSGMKDGNSNDLSLHAALPVKKGEKWACNFWIWD